MATPFARIAVVGTGLIGGSFAMAARAALPGVRITGWDKPEILERAQSSGVIDEGHSELGKAIAGADLIYLALPVGLTLERIPEIAHRAPPGSLVSDAASTKRAVCAAAEKHFSKGALFLGGHPMAGSEGSGLSAADAGLFRGAKYALIGKGAGRISGDARVEDFVGLIEAMGGTPMWMDAATHDRAAAVVSHLPQLLAVALASVAHDATDQTGMPLRLAGRGLRDALRLAGSPYSVWRDIVLTNSDNLEGALDRITQVVEHLRESLRRRALEQDFAVANEVYKILRDI
jgi:prephenate dehydrogenase